MKTFKLFTLGLIFMSLSILTYAQKSTEIAITSDIPLAYDTPDSITPAEYPYFALNIYLHNMQYFRNVILNDYSNQSKYLNKNYRGKLQYINSKVIIESEDYFLEYPLFAIKKSKGLFDLNIAHKIAILGMKPVKLNTSNTPKVTIAEMGEMKVISDGAKFIFKSLQTVLDDPTKFANPSTGIMEILNDGMDALDEVFQNDKVGFSGKSTAFLLNFDENGIHRYKYHSHIILPEKIGLSPNEDFELRFDTTETGDVIDVFMARKDSTQKYLDHPYYIVEIGYTNYLNLSDKLPSQIIEGMTLASLTTTKLEESEEYLSLNGSNLSSHQRKCESELLRFLYDYVNIKETNNQNEDIEIITKGFNSYYRQKVGITTPEVYKYSVYKERFKAYIDSVVVFSMNTKLPFRKDVDTIISIIENAKSISYDNIDDFKQIHSEISFYTKSFASINETQFFKGTLAYSDLNIQKSLIERKVYEKYLRDTVNMLSTSLLELDYDNASKYFTKLTEYKITYSNFDYCINEIDKSRNNYLAKLPQQFNNAKANYEFMLESLDKYHNQYLSINGIIVSNEKAINDSITYYNESINSVETETDSLEYIEKLNTFQTLLGENNNTKNMIESRIGEIITKQETLASIVFLKETMSNSERTKVISKINKQFNNFINYRKDLDKELNSFTENPAANILYK